MLSLLLLIAYRPPLPPINLVRDPIVAAIPSQAGYLAHPSGNGKILLTGGYDGTLQFWSLTPSGPRFLDALRIEGNPGEADNAYGYAISSDGAYFALSSWKGRLEVWQRSPLRRVIAQDLPRPAFDNLRFHPFKPWLLYGADNVSFCLDIPSGKVTSLPISMPLSPVPNSTKAVGAVGLIDIPSGKLLRKWKSKIESTGPVTVSPDGQYAVVGGEDPDWAPPETAASESAYARTQTLRVWRISDGKLVRTLPGFATMGEADPALLWYGDRILASPGLGWVRNIVTGRVVQKLTETTDQALFRRPNIVRLAWRKNHVDRLREMSLPPLGALMYQVALSPDGSITISHQKKATYRSSGTEVGSESTVSVLSPEGRLTNVPFHISWIYGQLGRDGKGPYADQQNLIAGQNETLLFRMRGRPAPAGLHWEIERYRLKQGSPPERFAAQSSERSPIKNLLPAGFLPNYGSSYQSVVSGNRLFSTNAMGRQTLDCMSLTDGRHLWQYQAPNESIQSTTLSANRDRVAFTVESHANPLRSHTDLCIADAATGTVVNRIPVPSLHKTCFSPDGTKLAVIGGGLLAIIDLTSPTPQPRPITGVPNPVSGNLDDACLQWTPKGNRLLVLNSLRPLQIIDAPTGQLLATLTVFDDNTWLAFSTTGQSDGSPSRLPLAQTYQQNHWTPAPRTRNLLTRILTNQ